MKHLIWFCSCGRNSHYHDPLIVSLRPTWDSQRIECSEFPVGYWDLRRADKSGWAHSCIEPLDRFSQKRIMEDYAGYYSDHNDSNLLFCIGNSFYVKAFKYFRGRECASSGFFPNVLWQRGLTKMKQELWTQSSSPTWLTGIQLLPALAGSWNQQ